MFCLRPARSSDLADVLELSSHASHGLTTLPHDEAILSRRIEESIQAFDRISTDPRPGDAYLLVLEDLETVRVVGTSAIFSKVGGYQPFYAYRLEKTVHASETLGVHKEIDVLHLHTDHDGPTEIGTLFLLPGARRGGAGRLLSLGRFLLMAEHPDAFDTRVIAEMRGVIGDDGRSDFWEAIGRHFFDVDLAVADSLSIGDKSFIADLMPVHPIYVPLLPPEVQAVIGRVHPLTEPALRLLREEGFRDAGMVDIFEAGPVVECARDEIRIVRERKVARVARVVAAGDPGDGDRDAPEMLLAARSPFRVVAGTVVETDEGVVLDPAVAEALGVQAGDEVRYAPMRALDEKKRGAAAGSGSAEGS